MHEIGIVDDLLLEIDKRLKSCPGKRPVKAINIIIGGLEHISPDHFEFHFRERTKGTPLEDIRVNFKKSDIRFKCRDCGREFLGEESIAGCPSCGGMLNDVISGKGVIIELIVKMGAGLP